MATKFCICPACKENGDEKPDGLGGWLQGDYVSSYIFKKHREDEKKTAAVAATNSSQTNASEELEDAVTRTLFVQTDPSIDQQPDLPRRQREDQDDYLLDQERDAGDIDKQVPAGTSSSTQARPSETAAGERTQEPSNSELIARGLRLISQLQSDMSRWTSVWRFEIRRRQPVFMDLILQFAENSVPAVDLLTNVPQNTKLNDLWQWVKSTEERLVLLEDCRDAQLAGNKNGLLSSLRKFKTEIERWVEEERIIFTAKQMTSQGEPITAEVGLGRRDRFSRNPFALATLAGIAALNLLAGLSREQGNFVLELIRFALFGAFMLQTWSTAHTDPSSSTQSTPQDEALLQETLMKDIRTLYKELELDPASDQYACCPLCSATYPPTSSSNKVNTWPEKCTYKPFPTSDPCGEPLLLPAAGEAGQRLPRRPYFYQPLKSYITRLFSDPNMENYAKDAWTKPKDGTDIMNAKIVREFLGPDGRLFSEPKPNQTNLVFSLFVDWFNPFGNKAAGKTYSVGVIYMVCLNLPLHLRYKVENVYLVGVIPGPHEPSLDQVNHFLRPLVNDLRDLWMRTFCLSRTASGRFSHIVTGAVIPLVCDLPALRKTAGFLGQGANFFCSFCRLRKVDIHQLESWPRTHTWQEHLSWALRWKNAPNKTAQNKILSEGGVRWSELLNLPYWDPTRFPIIDTMHNLFIGLFQHHCRRLFDLDNANSNTGQQRQQHTAEERSAIFKRAKEYIEKQDRKNLGETRLDFLKNLVQMNLPAGMYPQAENGKNITRRQFAEALCLWHSQNPTVSVQIPSQRALEKSVKDEKEEEAATSMSFSSQLLTDIQNDIRNTTFPSWIERPPVTFGLAAGGNLKADAWRGVCTVSLIITLIRLWGGLEEEDPRFRALDNFVDLVVAVESATARSVDEERILRYTECMKRYLGGILRLYPDSPLVPNHHLALHLPECLRNFGPVHAWWCFPFERYNGIMGSFNINFRPGQMEGTFFRSFCRAANLRLLIASIPVPDFGPFRALIGNFKDRIHHTFQPNYTSSFTSDTAAFEYMPFIDTERNGSVKKSEGTLPEDTYAQLLQELNKTDDNCTYLHYSSDQPGFKCPRNVEFLSHFESTGATYQPMKARSASHTRDGLQNDVPASQEGNTYVLYENNGEVHAGRVSSLFSHKRKVVSHKRKADGSYSNSDIEEVFAAVLEYMPLDLHDQQKDPYRRFEHKPLRTHLCYNSFRAKPQVVRASNIISHFSSYVYSPQSIGKECIVVRNLSRR